MGWMSTIDAPVEALHAALDAAHSGVERILSHLASAVKPRSSWRAGELLTG